MNNPLSLNEEVVNQKIKNILYDIKNITVLNIAAGKFEPLVFTEDFKKHHNICSINLDRMYLNSEFIYNLLDDIKNKKATKKKYNEYFINHEIMDFLTKFHYRAHLITLYRYLEHVPKTDVLYFIYLLSTTVEINGLIDIIVPNYKDLANRILTEDVDSKDFEADDIVTTFELLNEPYDPHASIWTAERIYKFFELEGRFEVIDVMSNYEFDGRDIYLRALVKRIK